MHRCNMSNEKDICTLSLPDLFLKSTGKPMENMDISITTLPSLTKFILIVQITHFEGTVPQIFDIGPSLYLIQKMGIFLTKFKYLCTIVTQISMLKKYIFVFPCRVT